MVAQTQTKSVPASPLAESWRNLIQ